MSAGYQLYATAFSLGIAYNAAPGAVNTEALRRGLARGVRPALLVQLGALIGDSLWAAIALTGTALLLHSKPIALLLGVAGACFLLRLAWNALAEAWYGRMPDGARSISRGDFATGAFFSLANPFALAFWSGVGGGLTASGLAGPHAGNLTLLFACFVLGALLWCLCAPLAIGLGRRYIGPTVLRAVNALCGLALGYFGLTLFWNTVHALLDHPTAAASTAIERVLYRHEPFRSAG